MSFRASLKKLIRRDPADALRERAADLHASLPVPETVADATVSEPSEPADGIDVFAQLEFSAYELDDPVKTPQEWLGRFAAHSMAMHVADRTLRMSKPEMIAFTLGHAGTDAPASLAAPDTSDRPPITVTLT